MAIKEWEGNHEMEKGGTRSHKKKPGKDVEADLHITSPIEEVDTNGRETGVR